MAHSRDRCRGLGGAHVLRAHTLAHTLASQLQMHLPLPQPLAPLSLLCSTYREAPRPCDCVRQLPPWQRQNRRGKGSALEVGRQYGSGRGQDRTTDPQGVFGSSWAQLAPKGTVLGAVKLGHPTILPLAKQLPVPC